MITQHFTLYPRQRCANRVELGENINAVAILINHTHDTAHLTLDTVQPGR